MLCCKERSPQKKKYSNSKVTEENIAVVYYWLRAMIVAKFILVTFFFSLPIGGDSCVGENWLLTHAWQIGCSRLGRMGRGLGTFDAPVLKAAFNSPKISWLVFLYRDFGEQIEDPRMFNVTSETDVNTYDNSSVIILKSCLTLQVILPARTSLVTPSLIDDSAHP